MLVMVLLDKRQRVRNTAQVARHQHHVGGFNRHVRSRTDSQPNVGLCECRRVVDAVADERDLAASHPASAFTASTLPSGNTSATTSSMPSCLAIAFAVRALSPVIIATRSPSP